MSGARGEFVRLGGLYRELDGFFSLDEAAMGRVAERVSRWSITRQIEHIAIANTVFWGRIELLLEGTSADIRPTGGPTPRGRLVLLTGWIPRGKAQAPKIVQPGESPQKDAVARSLGESKRTMAALASKATAIECATGRLPHPVLGDFSAAQWLKFARIHTLHHLKIIRDIAKA